MATLERAIEIAARGHAGQVDKAGQPYILHPLNVMISLDTVEERIVGVLHDIVEDTSWTLMALREEGFPEEIVDAVDVLTKRPGETRAEAARRVVQNPIARRVKLADVAQNMDISRISEPAERDFARLKEYEHVRAILLAGE